jgi:hypothetical protein
MTMRTRLSMVLVVTVVVAACGGASIDAGNTTTTEADRTISTADSTLDTSTAEELAPVGQITTTAPTAPTTTTEAPDDSQPEDAAEDPEEDMTEASPSMDPMVALAVDDLSTLEVVAASRITVVLHERVTWRDGSLGCPVEGRSYTQALVEGYRIVLSIDGSTYHYHGSDGNPPFACENPQDPVEGGSGNS